MCVIQYSQSGFAFSMQVISKDMTINTITVYVYLMSCPKVHFATFNVGNSCHKLRKKRRESS